MNSLESKSHRPATVRHRTTRVVPISCLNGSRGVIVGVANEHSRAASVELALTWLNDKARAFVEPLDMADDAQLATESTSRRQQVLAVIVHILSQVENMTATERQRLPEIQTLFDAAPPAGPAPRAPRASAFRPTRKAASKKVCPWRS